jgi:asparagine synthase (glutamine-hydrolysing)
MCGVVGWVDFERSLAGERANILAMTATMALRGPDAEGVWLAEHAALGHRRLAVIDLVGGVQPMTADRDGTAAAAITYSGEVYNYRELRAELTDRGHRFRTQSDTEVVLRAYLEWGDAFVDRFNGMFAFGLWDIARERLVLARDRMGVKPLYYYLTPAGVVFGSEPKAVLAHRTVPIEVDADGLRAAMTMVKTPGGSLYRGMRELRPGHVLVVDRDGAHERAYWRLPTREHTDDLDTTVGTVRDLLRDIMTRQMVADVPVGTLLSGGLDSSVVTALAAAAPSERGGPVRSFAVDFVGQTENFRPEAWRDTPDGPFARAAAEYVGTDHHEVVLDVATMMDPVHRTSAMVAMDAPSPMGDMITSAYLLFGAVREGSTVALSGESADEVFGGYNWFHDPDALAADTYPWLASQYRSNGGVNPAADLLAPDLAKLLDLPRYEADTYRSALAEVEHLPGADARERRMREVFYLHLTRWVQILLDRKDRLSMAHGLEVRVPFCDHRLVEYVYNTPWSAKTYDGREKSLLRGAAAGLLPESVLERKKSPYPSTQDPRYGRMLRDRVTAILADRGSPVVDLLDVRRVRQMLDTGMEVSGFGPNRRRVELLISLDDWLRRYPVRLRLDN